jgi:hypothetical protein
MMQVVKDNLSFGVVLQSLIVAAITAASTGYVSAKVMERELAFLSQELVRVDTEAKAIRSKMVEIELRQARVIGQADTIHSVQDRRLDRIESRK